MTLKEEGAALLHYQSRSLSRQRERTNSAKEIIQVCRNVVTASQMQSIHVGTTSMNLQEADLDGLPVASCFMNSMAST